MKFEDNDRWHIGTPDLIAKVTGRAKYAEDYRADGMLFTKLLLPFEVTSVLILIAILGAVDPAPPFPFHGGARHVPVR